MSQKEISKILDRDVFFVREATEKERELFPDKKEGGFFTFALESGQKFVACFFKEGKGLKEQDILMFRPLNNMVPYLEEFSWKEPSFFSLSDIKLECKFSKEASEEEKKEIIDCFYARSGYHMDLDRYPPLLEKALTVRDAYRNFISAQRELKKILTSEKKQTLLKKIKDR